MKKKPADDLDQAELAAFKRETAANFELNRQVTAMYGAAGGWQDLETAPRDGTSIFGKNAKTGQRGIVHLNVDGEWEMVDGLTNLPMGIGFYPTHWKPA